MDTARILLVDDDADAAGELAAALEERLGPTTVAPDAYRALNLHDADPFDLVIVEVALPGASGIDLIQRLNPPVQTVVVTWLASPAIIARALEVGARAVLRKPCPLPALLAAAEAALRSHGPARYAAV